METHSTNNEMLLRSLHAAGVSTWTWHMSQNRLEWTPAINEALGLPANYTKINYVDLVKRIWFEDRESLDHAVFKCLDFNAPLDLAFRLKTNTPGKFIWLQVNGNAIRNSKGVMQAMVGTVQDITHKQQQQQNRFNELEYLRLAVDAHAMLMVTDDHGKISYIGESVVRQTGFDANKLLNTSIGTLFSHTPHETLQDTLNTLKRARVWHGEIQCNRAYNKPLTLSITAVPHLTEQESRWVFIGTDISHQQHIESALKETEIRYQALFENSPEGIAWMSLDGAIEKLNQPFRDLIGCDDKQHTPKNYADIAPQSYKELENGALRDLLEQRGYSPIMERYLTRLDGKQVPVNLRFIVQHNALGEAQALWCVCRDISERKQAMQALIESEAQYRSLVENAPEGILVIDLDTGKFIDANRQACAMFGIEKNQLLRSSFVDFTDKNVDNDLDAGERFLRQLLAAESGKKAISSWSMINHKGDHLLVELTLNRIPSIHRNLIRASIVDITERDRIEKQLLRSNTMETLGRLAGGVAQDFNNLLSSVTGYATLAKQHMTSVDDPKPREYLENIISISDRSKNLIEQLLLYSRGGQGNTKPLDLSVLVRETLDMIRVTIPPTTELKTDFIANPIVLADPIHLNQVILNLCINARDACEEQGEILITLDHQNVKNGVCHCCKQSFDGSWAALTVQDTGHGIARDTFEHIFDPFFTTKPPGQGTGMGLATAQSIAHNYGGHFLVTSEPGEGSCFCLLLPIPEQYSVKPPKNPTIKASTIKTQSKRQEHGYRILLVDDENTVGAMLEEFFEYHGCDVYRYAHPLRALNAFRLNPKHFDLLVTDQVMPHMSGLEMTQEMLKESPQLPIIICTGYSDSLTEETAKQHGIFRVLPKPIDLDELLKSINEAVQNSAIPRE